MIWNDVLWPSFPGSTQLVLRVSADPSVLGVIAWGTGAVD